MATPIRNVTEQTQAIGGQAIDRVRELPMAIPRQITKSLNYILGRGLIGIALFGVSLAGAPPTLAAWVALPLLTGFQAFMDFRKEQNAKHHLLKEFKDEIGAVLGKDPETVTVKDLQEVAEGNRSKGIPPNKVLDEEWDRIGRKRTMQFITTAVSGAATLFLINLPLFSASGVTNAAGDLVGNAAGTAQSLVSEAGDWVQSVKSWVVPTLGLSATSGLGVIIANGFTYTGLTLAASWILQTANTALDFVTFRAFGLAHKTTHDRIDDISNQLDRGKLVTKEQVLGVFVSANKDLAEDIRKAFGKDYEKLGWQKKQAAVAKFGPDYKVYELAYGLNFQVIKPQELAFAAVGQTSGIKPRDQYNEALDTVEQEVAKEQNKAEEKSTEKTQQSFVDRYTNGPVEKGSFLERISAEEIHAAELAHSRS